MTSSRVEWNAASVCRHGDDVTSQRRWRHNVVARCARLLSHCGPWRQARWQAALRSILTTLSLSVVAKRFSARCKLKVEGVVPAWRSVYICLRVYVRACVRVRGGVACQLAVNVPCRAVPCVSCVCVRLSGSISHTFCTSNSPFSSVLIFRLLYFLTR